MAVTRTITTRVRLTGDAEYKAKMAGINGQISKFAGWMGIAKGNLAAAAIQKAAEAVIKAGKAAVGSAVDFESALAKVAKTTTLNSVDLEKFGQDLMDLSERIPVTAIELAGIAETAGQLGIADKDLLSFTETIAAMGVSTNMSAEEAATAFARMANIMHTSSADYERLGSVVVDLGNNFATTESEITDMAQVISSAAYLVGMSEADVFAFSTTLSSLGIETAMGGSNLSKLISMITVAVATGSEALTQYSKIAGMTAQEFSDVWKDDPAEAILQFVTGLNEINEAGGSVDVTLGDMEIKELRLTRLIKSLASGHDVLSEALLRSRTAWDDNTALMDEATKFYGTTSSNLNKTKNSLSNLLATLGDFALPGLNKIMEWANEGLSSIRESLTKFDLSDTMAEVDARLTVGNENLDATVFRVESWVNRLAELEEQTSLTDAEQREWMATLYDIKTTMPKVAGSFDLVTGEIQGGTDALLENVYAAEDAARTLLEVQHASETVTAVEQAKDYVAERRAYVTYLEALRTAWQQKSAELDAEWESYVAASEYTDENGNVQPVTYKNAYGEFLLEPKEVYMQENPGATERDYEKFLEDVENARNNVVELEEEIADVNADIKDQEGDIEKYSELAAKSTVELMQQAGQIQTELNQTETDMVNTTGTIIELAQEAKAAWDEAYASALESINAVVSGYGAIEMPELTTTASDVIGNLDSQIEYLDKYNELLATLEERGVPTEILSELSNPTAENMETLNALASATDEELDTFLKKRNEVEGAKSDLASTMADVQTDMQTTAELIDSALQTMVDDADKSGEGYANAAATISSMVDGLDAYIPQLSSRVTQIKALMRSATTVDFGKPGSGGGSVPHYSHAQGLSYVPYDGYLAELHKGEMVLVSAQAQLMRSQSRTESGLLGAASGNRASGGGNPVTVTGNTFVVRSDQDIRDIATEIAALTRRSQRSRGERYA